MNLRAKTAEITSTSATVVNDAATSVLLATNAAKKATAAAVRKLPLPQRPLDSDGPRHTRLFDRIIVSDYILLFAFY
jgi:hypothetical protein